MRRSARGIPSFKARVLQRPSLGSKVCMYVCMYVHIHTYIHRMLFPYWKLDYYLYIHTEIDVDTPIQVAFVPMYLYLCTEYNTENLPCVLKVIEVVDCIVL